MFKLVIFKAVKVRDRVFRDDQLFKLVTSVSRVPCLQTIYRGTGSAGKNEQRENGRLHAITVENFAMESKARTAAAEGGTMGGYSAPKPTAS